MDKNNRKNRKELIEQYKQQKTYMGIFQVRNTINNKVYIGTCSNLKSRWLTIHGQLVEHKFANAQLQKEWLEYGPDAFVYEVLEEKDTEDIADIKWELKQMEKPWLDRLQPYGDRGYNRPANK